MKINSTGLFVLILLLLLTSCVSQNQIPPEVYSLATIKQEFNPIPKKLWMDDAYLWQIRYSLDENPYSDLTLQYLSYTRDNRILILYIFKNGTYDIDRTDTGTNHIAPPPLDEFMSIDSNEVLEIFYENESVQKNLKRYSPYSLDFEFLDGKCTHPIWILSLGDALNGSTYFYLDPITREVWEQYDYFRSDDFKQICPDARIE